MPDYVPHYRLTVTAAGARAEWTCAGPGSVLDALRFLWPQMAGSALGAAFLRGSATILVAPEGSAGYKALRRGEWEEVLRKNGKRAPWEGAQ